MADFAVWTLVPGTSMCSKLAIILAGLLAASSAAAQTRASKTTNGITTVVSINQVSGHRVNGTAPKLRQTALDMALSYANLYAVTGFSGIDCTGGTDSATGLQNAINAVPDSSFLYFPSNCQLKVGSTITITDRVGLTLGSFIKQEDSTGAPSLTWTGANSGTMLDFEHSDHPRVLGLRFGTDGTHTINRFIKFDGTTGGSHIGTLAEVGFNDFIMSGQSLSTAIAISISETAKTNHENSYIHDNNIICGGGQSSTNRAIDGVTTASSTTLTSATAAFVMGDAGSRIRLSRPGLRNGQDSLFLDTTIASVTNGTTVVLSAAPTLSRTGVQITTGTSYGIGIYQGPSQNAKHTRLYSNLISYCDIGIDIAGGSVDIRHLGGGFGGTGILLGNAVVDAIIIEQFENEGDLRGIQVNGGVAPVTIIGSRIANANQLADGFYKLGSGVTLIGSASVSSCGTGLGSLNNTNAVVIGEGVNPVVLTSMTNQYACSAALVGYGRTLYGVTAINDNIGDAANSLLTFGSAKILMNNLPTSSSGLPSGSLWRNNNVLTVVP
jgi:hypothetical protein